MSRAERERALAAAPPRIWLLPTLLAAVALVSAAAAADSDASTGQSSHPLPPYMLQLYERYQNSDLKGSLQGNTVRSILATKGKLQGNDVLLFNLSGVHEAEQILRVELHFYQRERKGRSTEGVGGGGGKGPHRLRVHLLTAGCEHSQRLGVTDLGSSPGGWQSHDVTQAVMTLRKSRHTPVLAARFESRLRKGLYRHLPFRKFLVPNSQPFLIVFSNDNNSLDALAEASSQLAENGSVHREKDLPAVGGRLRRVRSLHDNRINEDDYGDSEQRTLRSVLDNELPPRGRISNHVPLSNPNLLLPRPSSPPRPRVQRPRPTPALLPYNGRKRKNQKHRRKQLPSAWQKSPLTGRGRHVNDAELPDDGGEDGGARGDGDACKRRSLVVDFADIGWGEWIISPKSFEANYCAGTCPFPLTKNVRPSNHATIQSLVHAIGAKAGVPPPCCVPDSTTSLTLLYFDDDRNVVLKNYPSMTVESCACR